jgi:hypothetical protein
LILDYQSIKIINDAVAKFNVHLQLRLAAPPAPASQKARHAAHSSHNKHSRDLTDKFERENNTY